MKVNDRLKEIEINIDDLNKSIEKLVDRTINISSELLTEVDVQIDKVNGFVLVGGSSRLKCISKKLKKIFKQISLMM